MRKGAGKAKGGNYERLIGSKLSLWISKGQRDDLLCRTVGSGAQFTAVNKGHAGDLRSQDELANYFCGKFVIECKHWRDLQLLKFLRREGELYKALLKVKKEAEHVGKSWMLIARQNNNPDVLFMPVEALVNIHVRTPVKIEFQAIFNATVYMYILNDFLTTFRPEQL